jgi:hypothetical protein
MCLHILLLGLLSPQLYHRIHTLGAACWKVARSKRDQREERGDSGKGQRVLSPDLKEQPG